MDKEDKQLDELAIETNPENWDNPPTLDELKRDYAESRVVHSSQTAKIDVWLSELNVSNAVAKKGGRSTVQPKLIKKQAEWRAPSLSEPFMSTYDLFDVLPRSADDKKRAYQNQVMLNYQFNCKINKVKFIDDYTRTALEEGTVVVRTGWESIDETNTVPKYKTVLTPDASQDTLNKLQSIGQAVQRGPEATAEIPQEWKDAFTESNRVGQPFKGVSVEDGTEEVTTQIKNQPSVVVCDYKSIIIDPAAEGDIDKARFVINSFELSRSELEKDGSYINIDHIVDSPQDSECKPNYTGFTVQDKPRKLLTVVEYWGEWDIDDSGTTKQIVVAWVGNVIIRMEDNPFPGQFLPFDVVHYLPDRKSNYGTPDGELISDNQKIVGAVTRGMVDTLARSANSQKAIRKDAVDLTNLRKYKEGKDYEYNGGVDPRMAFHMHTYPEFPQSATTMMQMQTIDAENITGTRPFTTGASGESIANGTATVAKGALDAVSKRELSILRRLSAGIVRVGRKVIAMNSVFLTEEEVVRVTDEEFVTVSRDDLAGEFDLKLSISTAEADNAKAQEMSFMLQTMGNTMPAAMSQIILADIARLRNMPELSKRLAEFKPEPDPIQEEIKKLEVEKLKAEIAKLHADAQDKGASAQLDAAKAANISSDTDNKDLDFLDKQSGLSQQRDLEKQGAQARANMKLKVLEHGLNKLGGPRGTTP